MAKDKVDKDTERIDDQSRDLRLYWLLSCLICILLGYGIHALGIA